MRHAVLVMLLFVAFALVSAQVKPNWSNAEQPIADAIRGLRKVPDDKRGAVTRELAVKIRQLPMTPNKLRLASGLANLSTEGDFGQQTLQEVGTTLADALREQSLPDAKGEPAQAYVTLAQLVRYEGIRISVESSAFQC